MVDCTAAAKLPATGPIEENPESANPALVATAVIPVTIAVI